MRNTRLKDSQAGTEICGVNINNLRYADTANDRKQRGTKEPLDEENEKTGWRVNIQKTKYMASGPITS